MTDSLRLYGGGAAPSSKGFGRLPLDVLALPFKELSDAEKVVLTAVGTLDRFGNGTDATDEQIGAVCGKPRKKVVPLIGRLVKRGFLMRQTRGRYRWLARTFHFDSDKSQNRGRPGAPVDTPEGGLNGPESCEPGKGALAPPYGGPCAPGKGALAPPERGPSLELENKKNSENAGPVGRAPEKGPLPTPRKPGRQAPPGRRAAPPPTFHRSQPTPEPEPGAVLTPEELAWETSVAEGRGGFESTMARMRIALHRRALEWYEARGLPVPPFDPGRERQAGEWLAKMGMATPFSAACFEKTPAPGPLAKVPPGPVGQTIHD